MNESFAKKMKLESLRQRIEKADYRVDPDAVAAAIVRRLSERREILSLAPVTRSDARSRGSFAGFHTS